jgi:hypothetical protein
MAKFIVQIDTETSEMTLTGSKKVKPVLKDAIDALVCSGYEKSAAIQFLAVACPLSFANAEAALSEEELNEDSENISAIVAISADFSIIIAGVIKVVNSVLSSDVLNPDNYTQADALSAE